MLIDQTEPSVQGFSCANAPVEISASKPDVTRTASRAIALPFFISVSLGCIEMEAVASVVIDYCSVGSLPSRRNCGRKKRDARRIIRLYFRHPCDGRTPFAARPHRAVAVSHHQAAAKPLGR